MLPLYLSIEGLYSYRNKQEIDFTRLTEAGLFGIFGKVGSGKSSIIEAISFVLYGETERLNKQEKRAYNMLNLRSDVANIVFEFLNYEGRKFRFTAQWKRRKKFEDTTSLERYAYEWKDGAWIPLDSNDGTLVTQLTYPNFRRTIIIPQGQFKEFLELRGKDRSEMMKDIFNLDRFDLGPKVAILQRQNNSKLEQLNGALSGFDAVSLEILDSKQQELETAKRHLASVKEETALLEKEVSRLMESKKKRDELVQKKEDVQEYLLEQPRIIQLEKELRTYEITQSAFREILNTTHNLNKEKEQLTHKIEQLTVRKSEVLNRLEKEETEWEKIAPAYQQLDFFKAESEDLKVLIDILQNKTQQEKLSKRLQDGKPYLLQAQDEEKKLLASIESEEKRLDELKNTRVDTSVLLTLESWYQTDDNIGSAIVELKAQRQQLQNELIQTTKIFEEQSTSIDDWESVLLQQETKLNAELTSLQREETHLKVQAKLSEFAGSLAEGQPCPLCGALDHPNPMANHDMATKIQDVMDKQIEVKQHQQQLKASYQALTATSIRWRDKKTQLTQSETNVQNMEEKLKIHREQFRWEEFSPTDKTAFLAYKDKNYLAETHIKSGEANLKNLRVQWQTCQLKIEKYKNSLAEFEQSVTVLDQLNRQNIRQIKRLKPTDFEHVDETGLLNKKQETEKKITFLEDSHKRLSESIQSLRTEFAHINGERAASKERFQQLYQQLNSKQAEISTLLKEHGYSDIIQVQHILQKNMDVDSSRKTIQEFNLNLQVLLRNIAELEKSVALDAYGESIYQEKTTLYALKREELELQIRVTGALEKEHARLRVEFEKKEKLLEEYEKLALRKSNLTTLENLFRGSGFVNYVSSIHLQRLCEIANQRFHRLTKNNLSLTMNENNEFEVVDFLHNGFKRSVKTLSGGQAFQASLCLALALAESIQSMNKADKNFFFIDEGFGTQDPESMNTVFETLQYLNRDNRIVGIISHVEELKERIPRAITVVNDIEKGSQLTYH
ncbi:AAA family ATPase [Sphingobacterium sp. SGR-19]|uniref:AAA family ATPase n=1 Tax=Sphingobacterium sp. SGR-19 TaxID=2710886 RepID=UPI0013EB8206|nr:SMC family ATPase [Sphingobacterium sp. SGR-19]NGM65184.1 SMC family ATPase [Sphingobacterium sp. SGR-19]